MLKKFLLILMILFLPNQIFADGKIRNDIGYQVLKNSDNIYLTDADERFTQDLKVAIALGGGGARALVDIGVLKALEEEKIPVDYVVGTSMGAIVAVLYGSGIPLDQIEQLVTEVYFPQMFHLNFPFTKSLLNTSEFNQFLEKIVPVKKLEEFPIPTALLSLDLTYGVNYLAAKGSLSEMIQGPYAIPVCFSGQPLNELFLIDAGMFELTPAGAAKALGAEVVISITAFDELPYDTYESPIRSTIRMINVIKEKLSQEMIDKYSDITIANDVGDYSYMDFHLAEKFIELGYLETKKQIPQIKKLLSAKGISLREPIVRAEFKIKDYFNDIKYNRLIYDKFTWKPLFYFGKDYSIFQQNLFKNNQQKFQWGVEFGKAKFSSRLMSEGYHLDNLEVMLRVKKILPKCDLIGRMGITTDSENYEIDLDFYMPNYILGAGFANFQRKNFLHIHNQHDVSLAKSQIMGETDLYIPLEGYSDQDLIEYKTSHQLSYLLNDAFCVSTKAVLQEISISPPPNIYRGFNGDTPAFFQGAVEMQYTHNFPYSIELLQAIQLSGVKFKQFIDYQTPKSFAIGVGIDLDYKILGLKPSKIGGYLSYDFQAQKPVAALELDLTF